MKIEIKLLRFTQASSGDMIPLPMSTKPHDKRVSGFVEAAITLEAGRGRYGMSDEDRQILSTAKDAFLEGRFDIVQSLCWQAGEALRLSITGTAGDVTTPTRARREALERNIDTFTEGSGSGMTITDANRQWGTNFRSARACAQYVIDCDGEYVGLDYHASIGSGRQERVLLTHSCGQITDELHDAFPEIRDLLPWHLNDMKAGAPDQMAALAAQKKIGPVRETYGTYIEYFESVGLLESQMDGEIFVVGTGLIPAKGYKYGSGWVCTPLPVDILAKLHALMPDDSREQCAGYSLCGAKATLVEEQRSSKSA